MTALRGHVRPDRFLGTKIVPETFGDVPAAEFRGTCHLLGVAPHAEGDVDDTEVIVRKDHRGGGNVDPGSSARQWTYGSGTDLLWAFPAQ